MSAAPLIRMPTKNRAALARHDPNAARIRASQAHFRNTTARFRIDDRWLPDGSYECILTITLPNGHVFRFTASENVHDIAELMRALNPEIGFLGGLWKGIKKVAKGIAQSKVFKLAGTAIAAVAPALGPLAPAALGAGAAMKAATALTAAKKHAAKGNKEAAKKLVQYASKASVAAEKVNPAVKAHQVMDTAKAQAGKLYTLTLRPAGATSAPRAAAVKKAAPKRK